MPCPTPVSEKGGSCFLLRFAPALLAHRLAVEFQAISVVDDAIQDTVRHGDIPDLFVPVSQGHLRGQNQRTSLVAVITDFQKITTFTIFQRRHRKVIQHQNVNARELAEQAPEAAVDMRDSEFPKQLPLPLVQDGEAIATSLLCQGAS